MLSCRAWPLSVEPLVGCMLLFDLLRFRERLSLRLKLLIDEGVGGSSGLGSAGGDLFAGLVSFWARGPVGFC